VAVLRRASDDTCSASSGLASQPQANPSADAHNGLEAIYPKPRLSCNGDAHPRFPYLLKGLTIERSNQVWCSDITYIGLAGGFIYLFALMDWYSRYVLEWGTKQYPGKQFLCAGATASVEKVHATPDQQH